MAKRTLVRFNPAPVSTFDTDSKDPEAAVMGTLNTYQLWSQADGGNAWAMWELERRGVTSLPARPNPNTKRIVYGTSGCVGRGYWLTVAELDDASRTARILYNARRSDHDMYDRKPGDFGYTKPPGEQVSQLAIARGVWDDASKSERGGTVHTGGYSVREGESWVKIPEVVYALEGPSFIGKGDGPITLASNNPRKRDILTKALPNNASGQSDTIYTVTYRRPSGEVKTLTGARAWWRKAISEHGIPGDLIEIIARRYVTDYTGRPKDYNQGSPTTWRLDSWGDLNPAVARNNPQGMNMTMILGEEDSRHSLGGEWARWAEDREGIMRRNPRALRNNGGKRIIHTASGCTGRGYWLSVVELDEGRHTARVLYNARRDDYDVHDPYPANADRYVKPPGESVYFITDRGLDDIGNKVVLGGYSPIVNGVTQAPIPRSEYPIEGPFFVSSYPGVAENEWRRNPRNAKNNPKAKFGADGGYFFGSEEGYMYRPWIEIDGVRRNLEIYASHKKGAIADARKAAAYADIRGGFATFRKKP